MKSLIKVTLPLAIFLASTARADRESGSVSIPQLASAANACAIDCIKACNQALNEMSKYSGQALADFLKNGGQAQIDAALKVACPPSTQAVLERGDKDEIAEELQILSGEAGKKHAAKLLPGGDAKMAALIVDHRGVHPPARLPVDQSASIAK